jgi:4-carboxymuconolactone decarboxylase
VTDRRQRGLEKMAEVYGWEVKDGPGDHFAATVDHLFADIWSRPALSVRDRRLLLLGALTAQGLDDVAEIQVQGALSNEEFTPEQLREIALFLTHYVGWPLGTKLNMTIEKLLGRHAKSQ